MNKYDKIKSLLIVSSLLDLLGSNIYTLITLDLGEIIKNPYDNGEILMEYISHFITNGGITTYNFNESIETSSNILLMLHLFNSLNKAELENNKNLLLHIKKGIKEPLLFIQKEFANLTISVSSDNNTTENMGLKINYEDDYIGLSNKNISSDICVRIIPVGIKYYNDIDKMIEIVILATKLTHNNITSILSAIASAYFASQAFLNNSVENWANNMIELLKSKKIKQYIDLDINENIMEYSNFIKIWVEYIEFRFNEKKIKKSKSDDNLLYKLKFYKKFSQYKKSNADTLGDDCISCLIIAYDNLLLCEDNFEKNVFNGVLIPGNNITIGGVLGALYGLMYGTDKINNHMLNNILPHIENDKIKTLIQKTIN